VAVEVGILQEMVALAAAAVLQRVVVLKVWGQPIKDMTVVLVPVLPANLRAVVAQVR